MKKMGITIHYKGKTKSKNKVMKILGFIERYAKQRGYTAERYFDKGYYVENKVIGLNNKVTHKWFTFVSENIKNKELLQHYKEKGLRTEQIGSYVHNSTSESFCCAFTFNPLNKMFEWSEFTKTQIFREEEAIPNIKFHIFVIHLLLEIKKRFMKNLYINDEGDYYFTEKQRQERISYLMNRHKENSCYSLDQDLKWANEWRDRKPFSVKELIKSHNENLAVINNVGDMLKSVGWSDKQIKKGMMFPATKPLFSIHKDKTNKTNGGDKNAEDNN